MIRTSNRAKIIQEFRVMRLLSRAKALEASGKKVIHMEIGEADFGLPAPIERRALEAIKRGNSGYTESQGLLSLREKISGFYYESFGVSVAPERVFITTGASGGLLLLTALLLNQDENLLLPDPGYPCNTNYALALNSNPVLVPVDSQTDFKLSPDILSEYWCPDTRGLLIGSPANPTGAVYSDRELLEVTRFVETKSGFLISDEVYQGINFYPEDCFTALNVSSETFVVNSFSKLFGMTGWRVGWLVAPPSVCPDLLKLAQNFYICAPSISQHAALAAFSDETQAIIEDQAYTLRKRKEFLVEALRNLGFRIDAPPRGAYYVYAELPKDSIRSEEFCHRLLEQEFVSLTPGTDFGTNRSDDFVRFSFTQKLSTLSIAVERISRFLRALN
ncbi:aminotransferase class I/II-fold pyridoxal phosphate-dependent enzyme [Gammaproteobacteria bacterium]|nr:aminotransferase class I/II-fold pyridoxal phosphate-dependent enzyme [Gammaproteobacteria bacterium]